MNAGRDRELGLGLSRLTLLPDKILRWNLPLSRQGAALESKPSRALLEMTDRLVVAAQAARERIEPNGPHWSYSSILLEDEISYEELQLFLQILTLASDIGQIVDSLLESGSTPAEVFRELKIAQAVQVVAIEVESLNLELEVPPFDSLPELSRVVQIGKALREVANLLTKILDSYLPPSGGTLRSRVTDSLIHVEAVLISAQGLEVGAATREVQGLVSAARTATGETASITLESYFGDLADDEIATADGFRTATIVLTLVAAIGAFSGLLSPAVNQHVGSAIWQASHQIALIAGLGALAGYFARQAHNHRVVGNWAKSMRVQLQTIEAYLSMIDDREIRDSVRLDFGRRVFGDHPQLRGEPGPSISQSSLEKVIEAVGKLSSR